MNTQSLPVPFDGRPVNGTVQLSGHGAFFRMVDPVFQTQGFQQGENTRVLDGGFSFLKNSYKGLAHDKREYCPMEGIGDDAEGFLEGLQKFIEKLPDALLPAWEARDVTLQFAIIAADRAQFLSRYSSFLKFLKAGNKGWLTINPPELGRSYRMYYKDCTDYTQLTDFGGEVIAKFSVKFREPVPSL